MKIGVFDSGLGGLMIARAIHDHLPDYDLFYLGDPLPLPYGRRSKETVYRLTKQAVTYLFEAQNCQIVILACNTASASALRRLQQTWLAETYPDRRVLGVVVPTLEKAIALGHTRIGLIATENTVQSGVYEEELHKINPDIKLEASATPLLVPMIENGGLKYVRPVLEDYLAPLKDKKVESLILGCTHYCRLSEEIKDIMGAGVELISQAEITPPSLADYLHRHPEHNDKLSKRGQVDFLVTDLTDGYAQSANSAFGRPADLQLVSYNI